MALCAFVTLETDVTGNDNDELTYLDEAFLYRIQFLQRGVLSSIGKALLGESHLASD